MTTKKVISSIRENVAWIIATAFFMLIPFYFNTTASLDYTNDKIEVIYEKAEANQKTVQELNSSQLVQEERFKGIEKRLESIEKKLDYLIERSQ